MIPKPSAHHEDIPKSDSTEGGMSGWAVALLVIILLLLLCGAVVIGLLVWKRHRQHFPAKYADLITYHRTHSSQGNRTGNSRRSVQAGPFRLRLQHDLGTVPQKCTYF